jgi:hypothetical protein
MKTGIATTVSVVGVIVAGVAAFAVNNSVLGASSPADSAIVSTNVPAGNTGANSINVGKISAAEATATPITDTTTTYSVGSAGNVVLDTSTGAIVVTGIAPAAGYTSEPATTDSMGVVKVRFASSMQRIEFIAKMVNGQVEVTVKDITPPSMKPAPTKPRYNEDDDHEEDEHHDEDHDEDHEDEDDD